MNSNDKQQVEALSQRILVKCAHRLGGVGALAKHLDVSEGTLAEWLSGRLVPPVEIIMKAVSPLLAEPGPQPPGANPLRPSKPE